MTRSAPGPRRWPPPAGAAALVLAVIAAYTGALAGPFQFDDWWSIVDNPSVHSLSGWWQALPGIRPLLKLVNTLNWLATPHASGFRVVAIVLHATNALLLWALLRRWLPVLAPRSPRPAFAAFAVALLFALHPAATEVVTYASGRSLLLSTTCMLAMLLAMPGPHTAAHTAPNAGAKPRRGSGVLAAAWFAAALAVRETAVVAPLAWLLLARCGGLGWRQALRPLAASAGVLAVAAIALAATPGYHVFFARSLEARPPGEQLLGQLEAHAWLLSAPLPGRVLDIDPDLQVPAALAARHLLLLAGLAGTTAIAWWQRRQRPWIGFALAWYLLMLAPANSLLPRFDLGNDRHLYPALAGPLLLPALMLAALRLRAAAALLAILALAAGLRTGQRNHDYRSELALWQATITTSPGKARAWTNLGIARREAGDDDGAAAAWRCALALDPDYRQAAWNLATLAPRSAAVDPGCPQQR
ncbi:hypothetical protein [Arenimonas composti]|uniref:Uncharacterized protein n=1 Tax=Arenimonas composti TR7-09 = DSM 18010 TaxID=1121013 RepID=A0A091BCA0_9GAMM|nr:hypothetical protein [Arenimonas composti]KFN49157.1 hypothetical protein P873_11930 [Arenimonas composti TR7-09 = DSM 18010]